MKIENGKLKPNTMYGSWIDVELRPNKLWVIIGNLIFVRPNGEIIKLKPYLVTDYVTFIQSKLLNKLIPKRHPKHDLAAAFHDDCCTQSRYSKAENYNFSMCDCHNIFKEIMTYFEANIFRKNVMYTAVVIADPFIRLGRILLKRKCADTEYSCRRLTKEEIEIYKKIKNNYSISLKHLEEINNKNLKRKTITLEEFLKELN